jgi:hypothetical protein
MSLGITTIEVDTWLINDTMLAGHEMKNIKQGKTLKSVYLDPLFEILERANAKSERLINWESEDWKGVFGLEPKQELMLLIDVVRSSFLALFFLSTLERINLINQLSFIHLFACLAEK